MEVWSQIVKLSDWANFNQVRAVMPSTDYIGNDHYVFNVKGNHYHLVAMIFFSTRTLYVRGIFTHAEYDKQQKNLPTL